ncbi:hypothetical protein T235_12195 [Tannerella sp. oral taxon BU063 isolate Cell 8/11]|uniref:Uncharacterized protein n=1 Tax=Tannerella sp. oral taxon BU063 isolate Cell 8/11 TaxID=1411915 RepID=W2CZS3_9BACT|nr:hypothetical protein T235_12195 [Tannerella sp. oral taxon BU063 isolate Cell 8/11]
MVALGGVKGVRDAGQAGRVHQTRTLIDSLAAAAAPRGVRDAGQVWPGTRRTSQPPRGLGKYQNAPLNVSEGSESSKTRR